MRVAYVILREIESEGEGRRLSHGRMTADGIDITLVHYVETGLSLEW